MEPWLTGLNRAGVDAVQLRCKGRGDGEISTMAQRARELLGHDVALLINARPDISLLAGGNGVHLPVSGLSVRAVRQVMGRKVLVGRSTHTIDEVRAADEEGADYVTFGPVYSTPGKEIFGPPRGLESLESATAVGLPVLALGGITTIERLQECVSAGAWGIAGIRLFGDAARAADCVAALAERFSDHDD